MKLLKMALLTASALIYAQSAQAIDPKDKVLIALVGAHTKTFGVDDLFKEQINLSTWNQAINEIKKYVNDNARDDKKLMSELNSLMQQNDEMINTMKIAYNSLFAQGGSKQPNVATNLSTKLKNITNQADKSEASLKKETYFYEGKKNAREVLTQLAMFIGATANKAQIDITRKMSR